MARDLPLDTNSFSYYVRLFQESLIDGSFGLNISNSPSFILSKPVMSVDGEFFLSITGTIEHAEFYDANNVYCKYGFHFGPEWTVVAVSCSFLFYFFPSFARFTSQRCSPAFTHSLFSLFLSRFLP